MARRTRSVLIWRTHRRKRPLQRWPNRFIEKPKYALLCSRAAAPAGWAGRAVEAVPVDLVLLLVPGVPQVDRVILRLVVREVRPVDSAVPVDRAARAGGVTRAD